MVPKSSVILALFAILAFASVGSVRASAGYDWPNPAYDIIVRTAEGYIGGQQTPLGFRFNSVRFAQPPVGNLRFAPPQPLNPWYGVYNSTVAPYACPQPVTVNGPTSEDCLFMTIYVPSSFSYDQRANRDVVVYWHGGAFRTGGQVSFIGNYLANNTNKVVVVAQYRLGILGLMGHDVFMEESGTYGNYAIMDQQMTLMWVRENIRYFGGNPLSVTIEGQSAGAISVAIHSVAPASRGLYQKAIGHSGVGYSGPLLSPKSWITNTMWAVIDALGCSNNYTCNQSNFAIGTNCSDHIRSCVRNASVSSIMAVQTSLPQFVKPRPAVDGVVIPDQPLNLIKSGLFYRVPTIFSTLNNESTVLIQKNYAFTATKADFDAYVTSTFGKQANISAFEQLYPVNVAGGFANYFGAIAQMDSDWYYACPMIQWLNAMASAGHRQAYLIRWTYEASWFPSIYGAWHTEDIVYLSQQGCVLNSNTPYCTVFNATGTPYDWPLVATYQAFWANFLAKGKPGTIPSWKPFTSPNGKKEHLVIASPTSFVVTEGVWGTPQCQLINTFINPA